VTPVASLVQLGPRRRLRHPVLALPTAVVRSPTNIDRQGEVVSTLERDNRDTTIAKALLKIFEKANAIHAADRERLIKDLGKAPKLPTRPSAHS
jgi:hypothetical protein